MIFLNLISTLNLKKSIKISSFGTFKVIKKKKELVEIPKLKIEAIISARKVIKFKPSALVKKK